MAVLKSTLRVSPPTCLHSRQTRFLHQHSNNNAFSSLTATAMRTLSSSFFLFSNNNTNVFLILPLQPPLPVTHCWILRSQRTKLPTYHRLVCAKQFVVCRVESEFCDYALVFI